MWKTKWDKIKEQFLICILNIASTGSKKFQTSPTPIGRRNQPPIYKIQPEGISNSLDSPAPTRRRIQLLSFMSTNSKEATNPLKEPICYPKTPIFSCATQPSRNINKRLDLSL
jgi:hypothetical protein